MCKEIKKVINETCKQNSETTYADAVKNKGLPSLNKQILLIIKPKETQSAEKTKEELNKINPDNLKITNVESRRSRIFVIQSENCEDREKIKSAIQEKNLNHRQ